MKKNILMANFLKLFQNIKNVNRKILNIKKLKNQLVEIGYLPLLLSCRSSSKLLTTPRPFARNGKSILNK